MELEEASVLVLVLGLSEAATHVLWSSLPCFDFGSNLSAFPCWVN